MTLLHTEPTLWGSTPGDVRKVELEVSTHDALKRCRLLVWTTNRRSPMRLDVIIDGELSCHAVIGRMMSLVLRFDGLGANLARRSLWAMHNALGHDGYEVGIDGCGKDPMPRKR